MSSQAAFWPFLSYQYRELERWKRWNSKLACCIWIKHTEIAYALSVGSTSICEKAGDAKHQDPQVHFWLWEEIVIAQPHIAAILFESSDRFEHKCISPCELRHQPTAHWKIKAITSLGPSCSSITLSHTVSGESNRSNFPSEKTFLAKQETWLCYWNLIVL